MIGGNVKIIIQTKSTGSKNSIGENTTIWKNSIEMNGWLDFLNGEIKYNTYNSKIQESSHVYICDYLDLKGITPENSRAIINGKMYDILLIDDPMELHNQLEIFLKYIGGQNGS